MEKLIVVNSKSYYPLTMCYRVTYELEIKKQKRIHKFHFIMDDTKSLLTIRSLSSSGDNDKESKDVVNKIYKILNEFLKNEEKVLDLRMDIITKMLKENKSYYEKNTADVLKVKIISLIAYLLSL